MRPDGRAANALRPISIERGYTKFAPGSVRVGFGDTVVLCTVHIEPGQPKWMCAPGRGWITSEYSMLPGSTPDRTKRERGNPRGRTSEIERLIGRSLRAIAKLDRLGERTFLVDCDVLQADGGTRTAAITGAYVALHDACATLKEDGAFTAWPLVQQVAAVSVGIVDGEPVLDLNYAEDSTAHVDMNVVMSSDGGIVEVQGTAEHEPFARTMLNRMLDLAETGLNDLFAMQRAALETEP